MNHPEAVHTALIHIRWRIVWQRIALNLSAKQVSLNLCVRVSTVQRIIQRYEMTGAVEKKTYNSENSFRKITDAAKYFILYLVIEIPGILLREIRKELSSQLGIDITESALCNFLHKAGFTRQRLKLYAQQQDESLRNMFALDVSVMDANMFIFLDESGCDNRDSIRTKGYSLGKTSQETKATSSRGACICTVHNVCGRYTFMQISPRWC